jgi:hypothetical protein
MALELPPPDLAISLQPDHHAPRAARYCVRMVDRPSPDLRDVVVLLTSELVTRAVTLCRTSSVELVELRIWMPSDVARVELRGARELLCAPSEPGHPQDDLLLVDTLADRWSIDADEHRACIWFEIDRQRKVDHQGHVQTRGQFASAQRP